MTNDDGIEEVEARLLPVAEELRRFANVVIVVADQDRSGTSNMLALNRRSSLESRLEHSVAASETRHALEIHSVAGGYPADCVVLGIFGILADRQVDLVVSGPNGGANLADGWFGSGTVGAARTAAYLGIPAIAVSGLDSDVPEQVEALADWVARLAQSDAVLEMEPRHYLTVGVPRIAPDEIRGVRVAPRATMLESFAITRVAHLESDEDDESISVWSARARYSETMAAEHTDVPLYSDGWIVVTPMVVDEHADTTQPGGVDLEAFLPPWSN